MTTPRFIPNATPSGGTPFGNSYVSDWMCPMLWFNRNYRPLLNEEGQVVRGLAPKQEPEFLTSGSMFHQMMDIYYRSGCIDGEDTGKYSLDAALAAGEEFYKENIHKYKDEEVADKEWQRFQKMMVMYCDDFGPDSPNSDYPRIKVLCDGNGEPLIEIPWTCTLTDGYIYTCRTDMIVQIEDFLAVMEHKTCLSTYPWADMRLNSIPWDPQFTGEYWVLTELFPDEPIKGVEVNLIWKRENKPKPKRDGSPPRFPKAANRELARRGPGQIERWRISTLNVLFAIDEAVHKFDRMMEGGNCTMAYAASMCFPDYGTRNSMCTKYRGCAFRDLCRDPELEERHLHHYRPRSSEELVSLREWAK
jgi:hypothetical protein